MNPLAKLTTPSPKLVAKARERAQEEAIKRGVSIDRICVVATPFGIARVIELDA